MIILIKYFDLFSYPDGSLMMMENGIRFCSDEEDASRDWRRRDNEKELGFLNVLRVEKLELYLRFPR